MAQVLTCAGKDGSMYEFTTFFPQEIIDGTEVTPELAMLADIFRRKISFEDLSARAANVLKNNGCETIGDAYMYASYGAQGMTKTRFDILYYVLCAFTPCQYAVQVLKAFQLSREDPSAEMPEPEDAGLEDVDLE